MLLLFLLLLLFSTNNYASSAALDVLKVDASKGAEGTAEAERNVEPGAGTAEASREAPLKKRGEGEYALGRLQALKNDLVEKYGEEFDAHQEYREYVVTYFNRYGIATNELSALNALERDALEKTHIYLEVELNSRFLLAVREEIATFEGQASKEAQDAVALLREKYPQLEGRLSAAQARLKDAEEGLFKAIQDEQSYLQKNVQTFFQQKFKRYSHMDEADIIRVREREYEDFDKYFKSILRSMPEKSERLAELQALEPQIKSIFNEETKIYRHNARYNKLKADLQSTTDPMKRRDLETNIKILQGTINLNKEFYFNESASLARTVTKGMGTNSTSPALRNILIYGGITVGVLAIVGLVTAGIVISSKKTGSSTNTNVAPPINTVPAINTAPSTAAVPFTNTNPAPSMQSQ